MAVLSKENIDKKLESLDGWKFENNSIVKEFEVKDFTQAMGLVTKIGIISEKADHHPDILIHSWNKVKVNYSTHDEGGVTEKDISLAEKIESF